MCVNVGVGDEGVCGVCGGGMGVGWGCVWGGRVCSTCMFIELLTPEIEYTTLTV